MKEPLLYIAITEGPTAWKSPVRSICFINF
jgi:hypothetical protein